MNKLVYEQVFSLDLQIRVLVFLPVPNRIPGGEQFRCCGEQFSVVLNIFFLDVFHGCIVLRVAGGL